MPNLTNLMVGWKERPSKGGYHAMTLRLDKFKMVDEWTRERAEELMQFCVDFRINHPLIEEVVHDVSKCAILFNEVNKF